MALRSITTERQRRLGAELRKLRELAGLNVADAGAHIGMARAHLSHVEGGRTAIPSSKLRQLCQAYGYTSAPIVDVLVEMSEDDGKGWWHAYRHTLGSTALDLAELEHAAVAFRTYESLFVPGLLQTAEYTRAIFRSSEQNRTGEEQERAAQFREERQKILSGESPASIHAVIHEAALHVRFGGAATMRKQLLHLIRLAERPHVTIQILPFTAEGLASFSTPFLVVESHRSTLRTVLTETPAGSTFLHDTVSTERYEAQFSRLAGAALPLVDPKAAPADHDTRDSITLIQHVLYTLQGA
ncbi:helix-turn-helix transcriptional regulator [Streptomyces sp. NPDC048442]|uniref:helix-turn-helix domain-containing protein n=1 Tax=Streptomyces sp. NPDC048442 TaxID=3154823 RepID=UPI003437F8F1